MLLYMHKINYVESKLIHRNLEMNATDWIYYSLHETPNMSLDKMKHLITMLYQITSIKSQYKNNLLCSWMFLACT